MTVERQGDSVAQEPRAGVGTPARPAEFVPTWLAVLVVVLLLAVMMLGGYVLRGVVAGDRRASTPQEADVLTWRAEVKKNPTDVQAHVQLGYAYQQAGRYDKALDEYAYVIARDPKNTAALYNRGIAYQRLNLDKEAEKALWDVLEVQPDHTLAAKALGEIYAARGQYRSLLKAVKPVVEAHPQMADLQYLMGLAYENTGHPDWAKTRYRLAIEYAPDMTEARDGLKRLGEVLK